MNALLLSACSCCGALVLRHRTVDGRQITCAQLARIDEQLRQSGLQPLLQTDGELEVLGYLRDLDRAIARATLHAGEI